MGVRTHRFNGRLYKIDIGEIDGFCDQYKEDGSREIFIGVDLNTKNGLITAIHEALHASRWSETENVVDRVSTDIGGFLWRLGYRASYRRIPFK